jgi:2-alkyl-3-oxoalkanoate reductase
VATPPEAAKSNTPRVQDPGQGPSTAAAYDRSPGVADVDEASPLVADEAGAYALTKRDTDAALGEVDGITRVILRPPAILGAGESSIWNTLRPADIRDDEQARRAVPDKSFAWVHVDDLATLAADVATGQVAEATDPIKGPVEGDCTAVNVAAGPATARYHYETVTRTLGVEPGWDDEPAWTGRILADRAQAWGWTRRWTSLKRWRILTRDCVPDHVGRWTPGPPTPATERG